MFVQLNKKEIMSSILTKVCRKVSAITLLMIILQTAYGQYDFKDLDALLTFAQKDIGRHAVVLLYKDGKTIYKKELGAMKLNEQVPIASCSKWLTAALVMTLVDEGKISLDDRASKYLPIFKEYGKEYITIRHCLTHQTGIKQEPISLGSIVFRKKYETLAEEVNDFASKKEIDYNPGEGFYYGSIGLDIAARVCEVVTKRPFVQLITERLFRPLGMRGTTFANEDFNAGPNPSGGARSTAADYLNFTTMLLNKGVFNDKRILSDSAVALMMTQQITTDKIRYAPPVAQGYTYGLGAWIMNADANGKATVITCPGLFGSFPLIDYCRGYTLVVFTKSLLTEHKKEFYNRLKGKIDEALGIQGCN